MGIRSTVLALATVALLAAVPPPARAEVLLETIDADVTVVTTGKVQLTQGTRYTLEVTGTMTSTGPEGYGFKYDAPYCYEGIKFDHPECVRGGPADHGNRNTNFVIGAGSDDRWGAIDHFADPAQPYTDTAHEVDYQASHSYTVTFYAPASAPLRAGGGLAVRPCNCSSTEAGSFEIKVFGPSAPPPSEPPPATQPPTTEPPATQPAIAVADPCRTAASALARIASVCSDVVKSLLGSWTQFAAPPPAGVVKVETIVAPETRQLLIEAGITDTDTQDIVASLVVRLKAANHEQNDAFSGCLTVFGSSGDPEFVNGKVISQSAQIAAMVVACAKIAYGMALPASGAKVARISAGSCQARFYPMVPAKYKGAKRRRLQKKSLAAAHKQLKLQCTAVAGKTLSIRMDAPKGRTLNQMLTDTPHLALGRKAAKGARTGPGARMAVRFR